VTPARSREVPATPPAPSDDPVRQWASRLTGIVVGADTALLSLDASAAARHAQAEELRVLGRQILSLADLLSPPNS